MADHSKPPRPGSRSTRPRNASNNGSGAPPIEASGTAAAAAPTNGTGNGAGPRPSAMADIETAALHHRLDLENRRLIEQQRAFEAEIESLRRALEQATSDALTDPLTGLVNRRALDATLEGVVAFQVRTAPAILLLADIDKFKKLNDAHGHHFGDAVLRITGQLLVASVRREALVARIGGDEFALLLPGEAAADPAGTAARAIAERLCTRIAERRITVRGQPERFERITLSIGVAVQRSERLCTRIAERRITVRGQPERFERITLSIGVAAWRPDDRVTDWYARADSALYAAKRGGRNRVALAPAAAGHIAQLRSVER